MNWLRLALRRWFMADLPEPSSVFTGSMAFNTLDLQPGDAVALMIEKPISIETHRRIQDHWNTFWQGRGQLAPGLLIFDSGVKLCAVRMPQPASAT